MLTPKTLPIARRMRSRRRWLVAVAFHARRMDRGRDSAVRKLFAREIAVRDAWQSEAAHLMRAWRGYVERHAHGQPVIMAPGPSMPLPAGTEALPPELAGCVRDLVESAAWLEWALDSLIDDLDRQLPGLDLPQATLQALDAQSAGLAALVDQWFVVTLSLRDRLVVASVPQQAHQALATGLLELGERLEDRDTRRRLLAGLADPAGNAARMH